MFTTGNATVDAMGQMHLEGNVIPHTWYQNLTFENGKPDLNSIIILAEIIYWHRPTYVKDEVTGQLLGIKKKFKADLLQRNYESFANQFNLSKKQVKEAFDRIEELGVVKREFRTVGTGPNKLYNVMFISLDVGLLEGITFKVGRVLPQKSPPSNLQSGEGGDVEVGTNTEITTKITTNINNDDDNKAPAYAEDNTKPKPPNAFQFYEQNGFGGITSHVANKISNWIDDLTDELVVHAMKLAVENNVLRWNYVETILKDWSNKKFTTIADVEADRLRFEAQKQQKQNTSYRGKSQRRTEVVPDWFNKRNEASNHNQMAPVTESIGQAINFEEERQRVLAKMNVKPE
ncbi:DnaD domain-containing protein [Lysinibacillus sp. UGB7]|uniref:DnaD domain-containing protein n=1 Tax=Lysinibacillus sp. UGB7 TaxID=3411039 RepID=UPI003B810D0C